jgi:superfamily II DNA/RNA helicase
MIEEGGHRANSLLIKKNLHKNCQSLFFSATFPPEVVSFAEKMVESPDRILIEEGDEFLVSASTFNTLTHQIVTHLLLVPCDTLGRRCNQATLGRYKSL